MSRPVLLGIDVGTSGLKAVAVDGEGGLVGEATRRYPTSTQVSSVEQAATDWWRVLTEVVPGVVAGREVLGVAVTSQAPTLVPLDRQGEPVGPALTWADRRAHTEALEIASVVPDDRNGADPYFGTAKLLWLARHQPDLVQQAKWVLSANGFIVHRLTGEAALDESTGVLTQAWDDRINAHDRRLAELLPIHLLPPTVSCTGEVGRVTSSASAVTGISAGTPVFGGGPDALGAALEAGALEPGDPFVEMTGFSTVGILAVPRGTAVPGFIHSRHCVPGVDLLFTAQVTTGALVDWVLRLTGGGEGLLEPAPLLAKERPGRLMLVPSFAGERTPTWDVHGRGSVTGLDLATGADDLMLAVFEGTAWALAGDVAQLGARGYPIDGVRSCGGGARNDAWLQIKSDALGLPVDAPSSGHGAARGAAYLAGLALGMFDVADVRRFAQPVRARFRPDAARHRAYESLRPLAERLRDEAAELAGERRRRGADLDQDHA